MERLLSMPWNKIYEAYLAKITRKGRTQEELDMVISWLSGYSLEEIEIKRDSSVSVEEFFHNFPNLNPDSVLITGKICGIRIEDIEEPITKRIRYLDKLVDELSNNKSLEFVLRKG